jgi:hypothetical protein
MEPLSTKVAVAKAAIDLVLRAGVAPDDPDFITIVEAETDALETVRRMLRAARMEEADVKKLAEIMSEFKDRKSRKEEKAESLRRAATWALEEMGIKRIDAPDFSATLARGRPPVVITDEAAIPGDLVRVRREPMKGVIRECLEEGREVPGATLGNPTPVLTMRVR